MSFQPLNQKEIESLLRASDSDFEKILTTFSREEQIAILDQLDAVTKPKATQSTQATVDERSAGDRERDRLAKKSRAVLSNAAAIDDRMAAYLGKRDQQRWEKARESLPYFLNVYFPNSTGMSPLSKDHNEIIARVQVLIQRMGRGLNIMPRGFIKSTLSENSLLWALLYGYRKYALFFAGTAELAEKGILSIKQELLTNELLLQDFPEACVPFRALEGKNQRCATQSYKGQLTGIECCNEVLRLPMVEGFEGSGGIVESYGLLAPPRGARYKNEVGENVRPDIAVLDDPQTDESAKSIPQTTERLKYIRKSIAMMGGHGHKMSMIANATVIEDNDAVEQLARDHSWMTIRVQMLKKLPKAMDTLWLGEYADIRRNYDRSDPYGQINAKYESTKFYLANRDEMDAGAEPAWENIGLEEDEASAIQHGMNIYIDEGPETFWSECQNKPVKASTVASLEITEEVARSFSGYYHRVVPAATSHLVFGIDVHDELLYYTVSAVANDFTGYVVDYGTWPEQHTSYFTKASAKQTLSQFYGTQVEGDDKESRAADTERLIEIGLEDLVRQLLEGDWRDQNGEKRAISCGLIDCGYKPTHVKNAIRRLLPASNIVLCSHGIGIGPTKKPFTEYSTDPEKCIRSGPDPLRPRWLLPSEHRDGEIYRVNFDTNFWKDTTAVRLLNKSPVGRWTFFSSQEHDHDHYISHCMSERVNAISANGRTVNVWENVRGDNHWWDTLVLNVLAASLCGAVLPVERTFVPAPMPVQPEFTQRQDDDVLFALDDGRSFFATAR